MGEAIEASSGPGDGFACAWIWIVDDTSIAVVGDEGIRGKPASPQQEGRKRDG